MTAINVIQTHDAIYFFSDGAYIDRRNGNLVSIESKVFANTPGRFAVGVSGSQQLFMHIRTICDVASNIDQARESIETLLPKMLEIAENGTHAFSIYIGGLSEFGERQLWKFECDVSGRPLPIIRCDSDAWNYSPSFTAQMVRDELGATKAQQFDHGFNERLAVEDPIAHGMLALEVQRKIWNSDPTLAGGDRIHAVGGFMQVTKVTADGIESRILHRWPDKIGERIIFGNTRMNNTVVFGNLTYAPRRELVGFKGTTDAANGINTSASSNYSVNSADGYVAPSIGAASMISAATGTAFGNMTGSNGLSALFDGVTNVGSVAGAAQGAVTGYAGKNYSSSPKKIDHVLTYGSNDNGYRDSRRSITSTCRSMGWR